MAAGNELINLSCGDVLTIDKSDQRRIPGDYEIMGYDASSYSEGARREDLHSGADAAADSGRALGRSRCARCCLR
jgi:hypothetical protein